MREWRVAWNQHWYGSYTPRQIIFTQSNNLEPGAIYTYDPEDQARRYALSLAKDHGDVENRDIRMMTREVTRWEEVSVREPSGSHKTV